MREHGEALTSVSTMRVEMSGRKTIGPLDLVEVDSNFKEHGLIIAREASRCCCAKG
jgi:hypothetical protein